MEGLIEILERWNEREGWRKIGNGPWEKIDCSMYPGGLPPIVFLKGTNWGMTSTLMSPEECLYRGYLPQEESLV